VILLDEAQLIHDGRDRHDEHPLSLLIAPIVALQRQELPLGLVLCGLPTLTGNLQKARSYSERLFRGEEIDSLEPAQALEAFTRPLEQTARSALGNVNVLLGRLVDAGALYRIRKGEYAYTAPKFRDYLLRSTEPTG
jgi:hypothetical protein